MTGKQALELLKGITDETPMGTFLAIVRSAVISAYGENDKYTEAFELLAKAQVSAITVDRSTTPKDGA